MTLFTDEKLFQLPSGSHKRWQEGKNRMKKQKLSRHPAKIMVWGGIGYYFKTKLVFCDKNEKLNSRGYLEILKHNLPPKSQFSSDCPKGKEDDWHFLHYT